MNLRLLSPLLAAAVLLGAGSAVAHGPKRNELSLGAGGFVYASFRRPSATFLVAELAYHRRMADSGPLKALLLGGGLRTGTPAASANFPLEGFVQAQFTAGHGVWDAAVGPEVGLSGFARLVPLTLPPRHELEQLEDQRMGPVYVAMSVAPLRFRLGSFLLSAAELHVGTAAPHFGSALRVQVGLIRVGGVL